MQHLYAYTIQIPLRYSTYSIASEDSEIVLGLKEAIVWSEPQTVNAPHPLQEKEIFTAAEEITFCISNKQLEHSSNTGQPSCFIPDKEFICMVSNVIAFNKSGALALIEASVIRCCKALSMLMCHDNYNRRCYHPRVEADYKTIQFDKVPYEPYEALIRQKYHPVETIDADGKRILHVCIDGGTINVKSSIHTTIFGNMDSSRFMELYHYEASKDMSVLMDEFYMALGLETISSKFFHLFTIIEYIERYYAHLAESDPFFDEEDKKKLLENIKNMNLSPEKMKRINNIISDAVKRTTCQNREEKLVRILHRMGIKEFINCDTQFVVDTKSIGELITLRNSYFHGDGQKLEQSGKHVSVEEAVARLMYICERIITALSVDK